jgi:integrase
MVGKKHRPDGLPGRVYRKNGALYYVASRGSKRIWHRLGKEWDRDAKRKYADLDAGRAAAGTVAAMLDAYLASPRRTAGARTRKDNEAEAEALKSALGRFQIGQIKPPTIALYLEGRGAPVRANREIALLSQMFSWALALGYVESNPCIGIKRNPEEKRERCPAVVEIEAVVANSPMLRVAARLAYLTAARQAQIVGLRLDQLGDEGILFPAIKKGDPVLVEWTQALRDAVNEAKALPRKIKSATHVFTGRKGQPLTQEGFQSSWQRAMGKWLQQFAEEERAARRFTFHDIRSRAVTDAERQGLDAQALAGHRSASTTLRYLRGRRAKKVRAVQ